MTEDISTAKVYNLNISPILCPCCYEYKYYFTKLGEICLDCRLQNKSKSEIQRFLDRLEVVECVDYYTVQNIKTKIELLMEKAKIN